MSDHATAGQPVAEMLPLSHPYERGFVVSRLVVFGVPVTPQDLSTPGTIRLLAERITAAAGTTLVVDGKTVGAMEPVKEVA